MTRVFVSYARRDERWALAAARHLRARGIDAWLDLDSAASAEPVLAEIAAAIRTSAAVVWVARRDTPVSYWVGLELSLATSMGRPIRALDPDCGVKLRDQVLDTCAVIAGLRSQATPQA